MRTGGLLLLLVLGCSAASPDEQVRAYNDVPSEAGAASHSVVAQGGAAVALAGAGGSGGPTKQPEPPSGGQAGEAPVSPVAGQGGAAMVTGGTGGAASGSGGSPMGDAGETNLPDPPDPCDFPGMSSYYDCAGVCPGVYARTCTDHCGKLAANTRIIVSAIEPEPNTPTSCYPSWMAASTEVPHSSCAKITTQPGIKARIATDETHSDSGCLVVSSVWEDNNNTPRNIYLGRPDFTGWFHYELAFLGELSSCPLSCP